MPSYGFRIRFLLSEAYRINHNANILQISLPTGDKEVLLKSVSVANIKDSINLAIVGSGFSSEHEADICGRRVKNSLLLCGLRLQMGIDVGKDKARGGITKYGKEWLKKTTGIKEETLLLNDIHGLCVYPEEKGVDVRFVSIGFKVHLGQSSTKFVEEFKKAYKLSPKLTDKQSLALELYNTSHFESSLRARFLTLVTAIECLCVRATRPKTVLDFLKKLIDTTEGADLEPPERKSLIDGLKNLKTESVRKSCLQLAEKHLGGDAMSLFQECYSIRGGLAHDGKCPGGADIGTYTPKLDKLVSQLILADIENSAGK